jgi:hypothetical protein
MIATVFVLSVVSLFVSLTTLVVAIGSALRADQAVNESDATVFAADEVFEDHEDRLTTIERYIDGAHEINVDPSELI